MLPLPDPAEILRRGDEARVLLEHPAFISVLNDLSTLHLSGMVSSPPGPAGAEAREHHHLMHCALSEIAGQLKAYVSAAEEIERHLSEQQDEELD